MRALQWDALARGDPVSDEKPDITPLAYPPETVLTQKQLALWLQISERTVRDLPLPRLKLPAQTIRYCAGDVLAYLTGKRGVA
jgi:hypothetical protein